MITVVTPTIRGDEALVLAKESLPQQTFSNFEWLVEKSEVGSHDLNASFNRMLKKAQGELIVFLEDYTKIERDGLQKFWDAYQMDKNTFFTAPVGKTLDFKEISWDWREHKEDIGWLEWEIDWGAAPLSCLRDIGGFDEELDKHWSFDNVNVAFRADMRGYKFKNIIDNKAVAYDHDKVIEHPYRGRYNPAFHNERLDEFRRGLTINYL